MTATGPAHGVRDPMLDTVVHLISSSRLDLTTEKASQSDLERALRGWFDRSEVSREHRLGPGDIPDFLIDGRIAVELKGPRHQASPTLRQLQRYAAYPEVTHLVLATARAMQMPSAIGGKPLVVINLGRAWL
jgi:hypothetical protein